MKRARSKHPRNPSPRAVSGKGVLVRENEIKARHSFGGMVMLLHALRLAQRMRITHLTSDELRGVAWFSFLPTVERTLAMKLAFKRSHKKLAVEVIGW